MLVTALNQHIGYNKAAEIAHLAWMENLTLKEATLKLGYLNEIDFDRIVDPHKDDFLQLGNCLQAAMFFIPFS